MKDNTARQDTAKTNILPIAAAVVGVGAIVAGAVVMSDKDRRRKVKTALTNAKAKVMDYKDQIQEKSVQAKEDIKEKAGQVGDRVKKLYDVAKQPIAEDVK